MAHVRQFPIGVPFRAELPSTIGTYWDNAIVECVDGVGGGTYAGAIILTNASLTTTSSVNTTGNVTAGVITSNGNLVCNGIGSFGGNVGIIGILTCNSDIDAIGNVICSSSMRASSGSVEGQYAIADKSQPRSVNEQSIDCNGGAATVALDLTLHDHFLVHLSDSSGATTTAVLHAVTFAFSAGANPDAAVKKGSKYRVVFDCIGQTGGLGLDFSVWPTTVNGYTKSDSLGPRTGDVTGVGGGNDFMIWDIEYTGALFFPYKATLVAMGGAL